MNSVPKSNHTNNINAIDMQMALIVTRRALSAYLFLYSPSVYLNLNLIRNLKL